MMTADSAFDANDFLSQTTEDAGDTKYTPIPQGEYVAVIEDVIPRNAETKRGTSLVVDIVYNIDDPNLLATMGRDKVTVKQGLFPDTVTGPGGKPVLDWGKGKNVQLGKIREAVNQNNPGQTWNMGMLKGAGPVKIKVIQKPDPSSDEIFSNVKSVGKIS